MPGSSNVGSHAPALLIFNIACGLFFLVKGKSGYNVVNGQMIKYDGNIIFI